jgi:hypothetical protein
MPSSNIQFNIPISLHHHHLLHLHHHQSPSSKKHAEKENMLAIDVPISSLPKGVIVNEESYLRVERD